MPEFTHSFLGRRFRLLRVYAVTFRVLAAYVWLKMAGLFRGPDWVNEKRPEVHRRSARRVVRLILDLKGLFIKVGQLISILTNFLPEDFRRELEGLQDRIPPRPIAEIESRIRSEFGRGSDELFVSFDVEPLASASLAQVHEAQLEDGRRVAVKVQHAYIEEIARLDLKTIRNVLSLVSALVRVRGLGAQYNQIETMIREELDFVQEARNLEAIASNFEGDLEVGFPAVVHERSTRRVLTTEYVVGTKVSNIAALDERGIDRHRLAERIVKAYCRMIFIDGLYHADPHPGNILIRPNGGIVFIDFGAVARLTPEMQQGIPELIMGVLHRDSQRIQMALRQIGFIARNNREQAAIEFMDRVHERFLESIELETFRLQDINVEAALETKLELLADFRRLGISFRDLTATFQVPRNWILLERTLLLLTGLCTHLSPEMNPLKIIRPYLEEFVLGPERNWRSVLTAMMREMALSAVAIPDELRRLLTRANRGEAEVRVRGFQEGTRLLYALGHQLIYSLLALGFGIFAYLTHVNAESTLATLFTSAAVVFLLFLGISFLRARRWER